MLCQLVCLDRRYQRMNCFNIREVEALLKGRFFPDLVNTHDHRFLIVTSTLGLRFKTNNLDTVNSSALLFYQYGLQNTTQNRYNSFTTSFETFGTSYEFFATQSLKTLIIYYINYYCYSTPTFFMSLLPDLGLLLSYVLHPLQFTHTSTRRGVLTCFEFCYFWSAFIKSEFERQ